MQPRTIRKKCTAIDLFAGCGGVTHGLRKAGFEVLAAVENDPAAIRAFKLNHPSTEMFGDIERVNLLSLKRKLRLRKGQLDLLAGCPPCQGFSSMSTRNGHWRVEDSRNSLINQFGTFVVELLPKTVMLENVPGLASERRFTKFVDRLTDLGYTLDYRIANAADYGVPQRRKRLILVASRFGKVSFPLPTKKVNTVRDAIGALPRAGSSGDALHDLPERRTDKVQRLIKSIPRDGGSRGDLALSEQLACHQRTTGFNDVYGRMAWKSVSPTITSGCFNPSKGRFLHPDEDRCITIREAALLQSFPANYALPVELGKQTLALLIGNALPPELARRFALKIHKHLRANSTDVSSKKVQVLAVK
ncbi:DNA cytosine methyltransferase [Novipirellula rosea]|uniref:DNA cytosine methyltransferase n=1 Tax=Novipirellula rosea TaxID=1031540 RepID=UPI0031EF8888